MTQSYPLKNVPIPLQTLIRPMLLISLALHGLLLSIPLPSQQKAAPPPPKKTVTISQFTKSSTQPVPKPSVKASPRAVQTSKPIPRVVTPNRQLVVPAPRPKIVATPQSVPTPLQKPNLTPSPIPTQSPSTKPETNSSSTPSPVPSSSPPTSKEPLPAPTSDDPFAGFPDYPSATRGCFGSDSCRKTGVALNGVDEYFNQQLKGKYGITPTISETGRKVYQLTKAGKTQFLSLIFKDEQDGTVYVLADQPRTLEDLKSAVTVPAGLFDAIGHVKVGEEDPSAATDASLFADPGKFFTNINHTDTGEKKYELSADFRPEINGTPKLIPNQTAEAVYNNLLKPNLTGFEISDLNGATYGGGPIYQLKKDSATAYLNLVPTQDRTGTIIVIWTSLPQ